MSEGPFEYHFTNVYQVHIPGTLHGFDAAHMEIEIVGPDMYGLTETSPRIHAVTHDVTITFVVPQSGTVILKPFYPS